MSKEHPNVTVSKDVDKVYHQNTVGHHSKSEDHFRKVVDKSMRTTGQETYSKTRKR